MHQSLFHGFLTFCSYYHWNGIKKSLASENHSISAPAYQIEQRFPMLQFTLRVTVYTAESNVCQQTTWGGLQAFIVGRAVHCYIAEKADQWFKDALEAAWIRLQFTEHPG